MKIWPLAVRLLLAGTAAAAPTPQISQQGPSLPKGELRVALSGNYVPLHGMAGTQPFGLEADLAQALAKELGVPVRFIDPKSLGKSSLDAVAEEEVDVALNSISPTPERAQKVDFTQPYVVLQYRVAALPGKELPSLEALEGQKVATPQALLSLLERVAPKALRVEVKSTADGVKAVRTRRADFVLGEDVGLIAAVAGKLTLVGRWVGSCTLGIAVHRGRATAWDAVLKRLEPRLEDLRKEWVPGDPEAFSPTFTPARAWRCPEARRETCADWISLPAHEETITVWRTGELVVLRGFPRKVSSGWVPPALAARWLEVLEPFRRVEAGYAATGSTTHAIAPIGRYEGISSMWAGESIDPAKLPEPARAAIEQLRRYASWLQPDPQARAIVVLEPENELTPCEGLKLTGKRLAKAPSVRRALAENGSNVVVRDEGESAWLSEQLEEHQQLCSGASVIDVFPVEPADPASP